MFVVIDCGSTTTRMYLLRNNELIGKSEIPVGVKDTVTTGSKQKLKDGIKEGIEAVARIANINLTDIKYAVASGMITSEIGLLELPHLTAPISIDELANQVHVEENTDVFPLKMPVIFIKGIKNDCGSSSWDTIRKIDLMRGEETQVVGLLAKYRPKLPVNIIELGSTTKLIHIDKLGRIAGSITTLSGQVYDAVKKETFIGGCVKSQTPADEGPYFSEEILNHACTCVENAGLLRSLLFTRFIQFSLPTSAKERRFFLESVIAADDLNIFAEAANMGFDLATEFMLVGNTGRARIYESIITKKLGSQVPITTISAKEDVEMLAVLGAAEICTRSTVIPKMAVV